MRRRIRGQFRSSRRSPIRSRRKTSSRRSRATSCRPRRSTVPTVAPVAVAVKAPPTAAPSPAPTARRSARPSPKPPSPGARPTARPATPAPALRQSIPDSAADSSRNGCAKRERRARSARVGGTRRARRRPESKSDEHHRGGIPNAGHGPKPWTERWSLARTAAPVRRRRVAASANRPIADPSDAGSPRHLAAEATTSAPNINAKLRSLLPNNPVNPT